jgi:hypothetical protein
VPTVSVATLRLGARAVRRAFDRSARNPAAAQERVRQRIVAGMAETAYGRAHGIERHMPYAAFAERVPLVDYEALEPWVERQMATREPILTPAPIVLFEETSGSSGRRKCIPYTQSLLSAFNRAFLLWVADLLLDGPRFVTGRAFFSISPAFREAKTSRSGVPIGLADDTQYLTPMVRRAVRRRLVVPPAQSLQLGLEDYRLVLACRLLAAADLEILSVWSPTYLLAVMDVVDRRREEIAAALVRGCVTVPGCTFAVPDRPAVGVLLREREIDWRQVWPALALVSCWTDGASAPFAARLATRFPGCMLQGKGLLATEAPITMPLIGAEAPVPLLRDVFLEFERQDGSVGRLHELECGEEAGVIISQAGGLVRYRMGDRVQAVGRYGQTPCLRFLGRESVVSDLVGEKLNEAFVRDALHRVLGRETCGVVVPLADRGLPGYVCVTERPPADAGVVAERVDGELCRAFQYRQARLLGQLDAVRLVAVPDLARRLERLWLGRGLKWGDVKQVALLSRATTEELSGLFDGSWSEPVGAPAAPQPAGRIP